MMLYAKLVETIKAASQEADLITRVSSMMAEHLGLQKIDFLFGDALLGAANQAALVPVETGDPSVKYAWQVLDEAPLSEAQSEELKTAGYLLAMALENLRLRQQTIIDPLTKLYNRAFLDKQLNHEMERCKRYLVPFSLLMIDIDKFKSFNDNYGHQAGDTVLKILAKVLKDNTRASDFVFRYGGEEFTILLPNVDEKGASALAERLKQHVNSTINTAERLREAIKQHPLEHGSQKIQISISIGISTFAGHEKELTLAELVKRADEALYHAKQTGRDRSDVIGKTEKLKLLIVDDEKEYTSLLAEFFRSRGYDVTVAHSGEEALELLKEADYGLMFLDIRMPGISGVDLLGRIPAVIKRMRVIMLTAVHDNLIKKAAYDYGICDFLEKPISIDYLNRNLMARILEMKAMN